MKKISGLFLVLLLLISMCVGCGNRLYTNDIFEVEKAMSNVSEKAKMAYQNFSVEQRQQNLEKLAPIFAKIINTNPEIKEFIGEEAGKQFDGDFDVLYDFVQGNTMRSGKQLGEIVRSAGVGIDSIIASIPYFNIAIPVNHDKWSTYDGEVFVIPMRYDIDDTDIEYLYGYDRYGNKKPFYANEVPDYPVVVLGINERVTWMKSTVLDKKSECPSYSILADGDGLTTHREELQKIYLVNDEEPFYTGKAEVYSYWVAGMYEIELYQPLDAVDYAKTEYELNMVTLLYNNTLAHEYYHVEFWEKDTGDNDVRNVGNQFTSTWDGKGETYYIRGTFYNWNDYDDPLGSRLIPFNHENPFQYPIEDGTIKVGYFLN